MKRVLALQHIWDDPPGYLSELLEKNQIACDTVDIVQEELPELANYQAIISMGGPQHVYEDEQEPYMLKEKAAFRQAIEMDLPILGICLGAQILASTLDASVRKHHLTELGFFRIPLTDVGQGDPLFRGLPGHQLAFHWHRDVFDLPVGATLLASSHDVPNQAFRYGQHIYGLQFHIELNNEIVHEWIYFPEFTRDIADTLGSEEAPARLEQEWKQYKDTYHEHTRLLFENFLRIAHLI